MEIKKLLEKYYEGKTSLSEEKLLKEYFNKETIPDELRVERVVFLSFIESSRMEVLDEAFDKEVMGLVLEGRREKRRKKPVLYYLSAVAAGLAFLLGAYFLLIDQKGPFEKESGFEMFAVQDPDTAFEETRKALYLISEVFNRGTAELSSISKFSEGTSHLEGLGKIHEVELVITSKK